MNGFLGADTAQLQSTARRVRASGQHLGPHLRACFDQCRDIPWEGPDAERFRALGEELWRTTELLIELLERRGAELEEDAAQQDEASAPDSGFRGRPIPVPGTGIDSSEPSPERDPYEAWRLREDHAEEGTRLREDFIDEYVPFGEPLQDITESVVTWLPGTQVPEVQAEAVDQQLGSFYQFADDLGTAADAEDPRLAGRAAEDFLLRQVEMTPENLVLAMGNSPAGPIAVPLISDGIGAPTLRALDFASPVIPDGLEAEMRDRALDLQQREEIAREHISGERFAQGLSDRRREHLPMPWDDLPESG